MAGQSKISKQSTSNGLLGYIRLAYYRYTLMTGLYVLTPFEAVVIQSVYILFGYFLIRYTFSLIKQLSQLAM